MPPVISRSRQLPAGVPLLVVTRGGRVESAHRGSVAVVAGDGRLLAAAGDPLQPAFLRSAAKPFQLVPFLAAGGEKRFRLSQREIALAAASHGGRPGHPLQRKILSVVSRMTGLPEKGIGLGVDGCSVPTYRLPLYNLALAYARLAGGKTSAESSSEAAARKRIVFAMAHTPEVVAGTGRFTTALMREFRGGILGKEGFEGIYAVSVPRTLAGKLSADGPVGIALKIEDGGERGRDAVVVEILRQLGFASGGRLARLRRHALRPVRNVRGDVVGGMQPVFSLSLFAASGERP